MLFVSGCKGTKKIAYVQEKMQKYLHMSEKSSTFVPDFGKIYQKPMNMKKLYLLALAGLMVLGATMQVQAKVVNLADLTESYDIQDGDTLTGIESIQNSAISSQKVLINGKVYILIGDRMYDATGKLVK